MFYLTHVNAKLAVYDSSDGSFTPVTRKEIQAYLMNGVYIDGARITAEGKLKTSPRTPEIVARGLMAEQAQGIPVVTAPYAAYFRY